MFHRGAVPSNFGITFDRQWSRAFYSRPVALVGEQLRHAREAQDYSIPDVVGMTNLMTDQVLALESGEDRKSTRLNSSHVVISYAVFCLKKKKNYT